MSKEEEKIVDDQAILERRRRRNRPSINWELVRHQFKAGFTMGGVVGGTMGIISSSIFAI